eukprot:m.333682 g.333682  ORF g.333682 m.333682 type:complete len:410 (-) comp17196_c0_seq1:65-1294(-)
MELACRCLNIRITTVADSNQNGFSPARIDKDEGSNSDDSASNHENEDVNVSVSESVDGESANDIKFFTRAKDLGKCKVSYVFSQLRAKHTTTYEGLDFEIVTCRCCSTQVYAEPVPVSASGSILVNTTHLLQGQGQIESAKLDPKYSKTYGILIPTTSAPISGSVESEDIVDMLRERGAARLKEEERKTEERIQKLIRRERQKFNELKQKSVEEEANLLDLMLSLAPQSRPITPNTEPGEKSNEVETRSKKIVNPPEPPLTNYDQQELDSDDDTMFAIEGFRNSWEEAPKLAQRKPQVLLSDNSRYDNSDSDEDEDDTGEFHVDLDTEERSLSATRLGTSVPMDIPQPPSSSGSLSSSFVPMGSFRNVDMTPPLGSSLRELATRTRAASLKRRTQGSYIEDLEPGSPPK